MQLQLTRLFLVRKIQSYADSWCRSWCCLNQHAAFYEVFKSFFHFSRESATGAVFQTHAIKVDEAIFGWRDYSRAMLIDSVGVDLAWISTQHSVGKYSAFHEMCKSFFHLSATQWITGTVYQASKHCLPVSCQNIRLEAKFISNHPMQILVHMPLKLTRLFLVRKILRWAMLIGSVEIDLVWISPENSVSNCSAFYEIFKTFFHFST